MTKYGSKYKDLKCLWDIRCKGYSNRDKKKDAYSELLVVYKLIKPEASIDDVKKKINTLRSNFRKELKKIHDTKRSGAGADDIYQPSSWLFEELAFLADLEKPVDSISSINDDTNNDKRTDNDIIEPVEINDNSSFLTPKSKKLKTSSTVAQQNELLSLACGYLAKENNQGSDLDIAKVWASKLKTLDSNQKLFAEKAINDILFEAQLGTLNRNSVHINPQSTTGNFSRSTTPLTWTDHSTSASAEKVISLSENLSTYFTSFNEQAYQ